jgi:hypothetical protein
MKTKAILVLGILLFLLLGCTIQNDGQALSKFSNLQGKYYVKESFSTNPAAMNDYITELAQLKAKTTASPGKIIEAELFSAQGVNYYQKAIALAPLINTTNFKCASKEALEMISLLRIARDNSEKAINSLGKLSDSEKDNLREGQLENMQNVLEQINEYLEFFDSKCSTM